MKNESAGLYFVISAWLLFQNIIHHQNLIIIDLQKNNTIMEFRVYYFETTVSEKLWCLNLTQRRIIVSVLTHCTLLSSCRKDIFHSVWKTACRLILWPEPRAHIQKVSPSKSTDLGSGPPCPYNLVHFDLKPKTDAISALETLCEYRPCLLTDSAALNGLISSWIVAQTGCDADTLILRIHPHAHCLQWR